MPTHSDALPSLRRNGQKPACEPCRKSKYSCDHAAPVCRRCERRGIPSQCTYHPAPMKGLTPRASKNEVKRTARSQSSGAPWSPESLARSHSNDHTPTLTLVQTQHGFLGSTSYSAVLTESQEQIGLDPDLPTPNSAIELSPPASSSRVRQQKIKEGAAVLELLRDMSDLERLIEWWVEKESCMALFGPFIVDCARSIREDLVNDGALKSEASMIAASEFLFRNTSRAAVVPKNCKLTEYIRFFTGNSLRWEAVGLFFTACGLCCNNLLCTDPLLNFAGSQEEDRTKIMHRFLDASGACTQFCEDAGELPDLGLWLMHIQCIYMSQVLGDAHYLVWRRIGDLSTAIFAQGIHQDTKHSAELPFWRIEMRRRLLGVSYAIDKLLCTFVGRPPRISQRYCSIHIPLDLEFSELALEGDELQAALANIDSNGWNKQGNRKSIYQRCFVLVARVREEVLELCLGPIQDRMLEKARDIMRRNEELLINLPDYIRYSSDIWSRYDANQCFYAAQEYLDILYNDFMLHRMMVRRLRVDPSELLQIAQQIMDSVLECMNRRGSRVSNAGCIPWIVVLYGLPAAGVLALELLQRKQPRPHPSSQPPSTNFSVSKVIQDLSVFVSSLKWVHAPGDGNYQLCEQARKMLQQILDKVLSQDMVMMTTTSSQEKVVTSSLPNGAAGDGEAVVGSTDATGVAGYDDLMFDFSWLDNAGFDGDFWTSLPDHPLLS